MDMTYPSWTYQGRIFNDITDFPKDTYGFIYEVVHQPTGLKYLGKKVLYFNRTLPPLKGQKRKRKVVKESDWKDYYGSHPQIKDLIKECKDTNEWSVWEKKILEICKSKKELTYFECKYLFINEVLEGNSHQYINDNILGKFFRKDFIHEAK
tara:strand:- start:211 stop:666 length:456 start_codon:yes stop_codon:yes gene_type:complete